MLYSVAALALTLLSGAQGQGTDADGVSCIGEVILRPYENCGSFGGLNVYWTYMADLAQVNILFESLDNGYTAFGFSDGLSGEGPMDGSNAVLGCQDWGLEGLDIAFEIMLPEEGIDRTVPNVAAGIALNLLQAAAVEETRNNGYCGVRFERLSILADVEIDADLIDVNDGHDLISGTPNTVVWARGPSDTPAFHNLGQGAASQDFILGEGDITDSPLNLLIPVVDVDETLENEDDGSANIASLSSMLIGAVAALTATLW